MNKPGASSCHGRKLIRDITPIVISEIKQVISIFHVQTGSTGAGFSSLIISLLSS